MTLLEKLRAIANALPPMPKLHFGEPITFDMVTLGSHIIDKGYRKDKHGFAINPCRYYTVTHVSFEEHYKNIKSIYDRTKNADELQTKIEAYVARVKNGNESRQKALLLHFTIKPQ